MSVHGQVTVLLTLPTRVYMPLHCHMRMYIHACMYVLDGTKYVCLGASRYVHEYMAMCLCGCAYVIVKRV